jgi:hypothetical protein
MKKNLLVLVFAMLCFKISNAQFGVPCTDLFISEYVSPGAGHAGDKTVEVYNPSSTSINLSGYKLVQYSNGTCTPTSTFTFPNKVIASGDVYVINNGATGVDPVVVAARDTTWGSLNFNGNDWLMLKNALGDTLDIFGQMCVNPGTAWVFPNGDSTKYMTLVRNPSIHNGTKTFSQWQTEWVASPMNTLSNLGSHTMNPCSSTTPSINFQVVATTVAESVGTVNLAVKLNSASPNTVTVDVQVALGSATGGSDYTFTNQTLTFPANSIAPQFTSVTIIDDAIIESTEAIKFRILNPTNGAILGTDSFEYVSITDNDFASPTFYFATPTSKIVTESNITFPVLVYLGSPSANNSSVTPVITSATNATAGVDYSFSVPTNNLYFLANSSGPDTIWVTIKDDCIHELKDSITIALRNPSGANIIGADSLYKISITDNDAIPTVSFSTTTPTLNENAGTYNVNVSIQTPNCDTTQVTVSLVGGNAIAGTDYTATLPVTVTFLPNSTTSQVVPIMIIDDAIVEGLDSIMLQLSNPTNGATMLMSTKKIYIKDNDTLAVTKVNFVNTTVTKTEADGLINIALSITNPTNAAITLPFTISGTCTANLDDTIFSTSPITIAANATSANIQLNIIDDILIENNENVIINLGTPTNAILGTNTTFTLTITDNDFNGINSISSNNKLSVYPNPATNQLTIHANQFSINSIKITNLLGQEQLVNQHLNKSTLDTIINVSSLPNGIYFIKAIDEKGNLISSKFTKQ